MNKLEIMPVRKFNETCQELGAGQDRGSYFVYDRPIGTTEWHKHCGPYSTFTQARDWILEIREKAEG